jgi:hypothetical protein
MRGYNDVLCVSCHGWWGERVRRGLPVSQYAGQKTELVTSILYEVCWSDLRSSEVLTSMLLLQTTLTNYVTE